MIRLERYHHYEPGYKVTVTTGVHARKRYETEYWFHEFRDASAFFDLMSEVSISRITPLKKP